MLTPTQQALQDQKTHTMLKGDPVFRNPGTGERWTGDQQIRDAWVRILKLAKVRYRWPYQARHTYASMMLSAGEHPMWVAKQMGHRDWTMIAKIYGKWMPAADTDAGGKAESLFAPQEVRQQKPADAPILSGSKIVSFFVSNRSQNHPNQAKIYATTIF